MGEPSRSTTGRRHGILQAWNAGFTGEITPRDDPAAYNTAIRERRKIESENAAIMKLRNDDPGCRGFAREEALEEIARSKREAERRTQALRKFCKN